MKKSNHIGIFSLTLLNVAAVLSIVNYPDQAEYGYRILFFILAGAFFFMIPTALAAAEMASAWEKEGGLYLWGREAFGARWGIITLLLQFLNTQPLFGTVLTFVATTLAYMSKPALASNPFYVYGCIVAILWGCTLLVCLGGKVYSMAGSWTAFAGTLIPTLLIILCAAAYFIKGNHAAIPFSVKDCIPDFSKPGEFMFLAGILVSLSGIDMTALHITELKRPPNEVYRNAIFNAVILIVAACIGGSLAIALVVPPEMLSTAAGVPQALEQMFRTLGILYLMPPVCILIVLGALSTVIAWILGPSKGLLKIASDGYMPPFWAKVNGKGIPVRILVLQAMIGSLIASVIFFMPSIGEAFWFMMVLTAQIYMSMYILMFATALRLRKKHPEVPRPFKVPGGRYGMWIVCASGIGSAFLAIVAGFIPPERVVRAGNGLLYSASLAGLMLLIGAALWLISSKMTKKEDAARS